MRLTRATAAPVVALGNAFAGPTRRILWASMVAASFLFFAPSVRAEDLGWRTILDIGCHHVNGTCYLTLSGGSFNGDRACAVGPTNEVRWDNANQDDGKRSFAALFGAFLAGKTVQIVTSGCTAQNVPTILYYHIR